MKNIQIPKSISGEQETINIGKNIVIVGANGAGKTRFGSKLEQINNPTKRISAQRGLQLVEVVQKIDYETADTQLKSIYKNHNPIEPQNDYQQVLMSLFAEESRRNENVITEINSKGQVKKDELLKSVKEKVLDVWNFIFPYRKLKLEKDRVRAMNESVEFAGTEMSDGEKVGLYLISQVLLAENDCILIIDEPELHLHKALMIRLWNKLEEQRKDCTFVYITHDLNFAVGKTSDKLIWIKSYTNGAWIWQELDSNGIIPENLYLEVLGSKKPILFVEGEIGSLDIQIYQLFYEDFTVIPCGSCEKVIEAVRGLRDHADLHDKKVFGIIDKDFRTVEQLNILNKDGIYNVSLNEVENVLLIPEIIDMVCAHQLKPEKKEEIITEIRNIYTKDKLHLAFTIKKYRIFQYLYEKFGKIKNILEYDEFKNNFVKEIENVSVVNLPNDSAGLIDILKEYPNKGLVKQVQGILNLTKNGYKDLVVGFFSTDKKQSLIGILKVYLPEIIQ